MSQHSNGQACGYKLCQVNETIRGAYLWPIGYTWPTDIIYFDLHSFVIVVLIAT